MLNTLYSINLLHLVIKYAYTKLSRIRTSKEEVLEQVLSGLQSLNQFFPTNYKLSKIYFSAFIRHYHNLNQFK